MLTAASDRSSNPLDMDLGKALFYVFLFASLFLLTDPFFSGYGEFRFIRDLGPIRYLGFLFGVGAAALSMAGMALNVPRASQPPWRRTLIDAWPILLFGVLVIAASLVTRFHLDIRETFLQMGVSVLGFPLAVLLFWSIGDRDRMLVARRFLHALLVALPIVIGWVVAKRLEGGQAFHIEVFLFIPLAIYFFLTTEQRWFAWLILVSVIFLGIVSFKNTAFLVLAVTLAHFLVIGLARQPASWAGPTRALLYYVLFVGGLMAAAAVSYLLLNRETYLPSGNVEVRTEVYEAAIARFLASPIYGTGFVDSAVVPLSNRLILGDDQLTTHSDMLDILSHGGVLGALLFVYGVGRVYLRSVATLWQGVDEEARAVIHALSAIVISGLVTAAFNGPLNVIPIAILFWFALGLLAAVADHVRRNDPAQARPGTEH